VVPIEAVQAGDTQVFAAREDRKYHSPVINLDVLAAFPSVRSVVASTSLDLHRPLPAVAELLFIASPLILNTVAITLVQIRIWNCEEEKAEHLIA